MTIAVASMMPNATFFVELALFGAVAGVIARYVVPPLRDGVRRRQDEIADARGAADTDAAEARRLLADARAEAETIRAEARREGHRIRLVSREVADGIVAEAKRRTQETAAPPDRPTRTPRRAASGAVR
ncbi:MAG TPA: hypothetical protein VFW24_15790 [Acidimicrobiales bacterium]|nr:hypothetical protein [Acidimicrobiales bacterium]